MSNIAVLPSWQRAEDSFLVGFSTINRFAWGDIYLWPEHPEWPKFSFLRLRDPNVTSGFLAGEIARFKEQFTGESGEVFLRIPRNLGVPVDTLRSFTRDPDSIVSVVYNPMECADLKLAQGLELVRCRSEDELRLWWEVNSDARGRSNPYESALWAPIQRKFKQNTEFYLLYRGSVAVTCGAIERFEHGFNSWGLGTRVSEMRKGYSRAYMAKIGLVFGDRLFSQVDLGESRYQFLSSLASTRILAIEDLYVC